MNMKYWLSCPYSDDTDCFTINGIYLVPGKKWKVFKNGSRNRAYAGRFFWHTKGIRKEVLFRPSLTFQVLLSDQTVGSDQICRE